MKIFSVIVCYNPNIDILDNICKVLLNDNVNIILIDNTYKCYIEELSNNSGVELIKLNENLGIAKAQNIGINYAIENDADIVVFFDQDSVIESNFISTLTEPLNDPTIPMVVSPVFFDKYKGFRFPSYRLNSFGLLKKIKVANHLEIYEVDVIISSGSAATKKTFDIVGLMNEDYFIDFVDTEWSLRCLRQQVPLKVVPSARMIHAIGDRSIDLKIMQLFIHSPLRSYYKIRNSFFFIRSPYVPLLFGLKEIASALIHNFIIIFLVKNKRQYFKNYYQAILDGIIVEIGKKKNKWI